MRIPMIARVVGVVAAAVMAGLLATAATSSPSQDQCSRPVSERVGGWACPTGDQPGPAIPTSG
jgi:hypothetical protein